MKKHITIVTLTVEIIAVDALCRMCNNSKRFRLSTAAFDAWNKGELIQRAFPTLSEDDRELLISGACGPCFDKLFEGTD